MLTLKRTGPTKTGWGLFGSDGKPVLIDGCYCVALTKWEARQVCDFLGIPYIIEGD